MYLYLILVNLNFSGFIFLVCPLGSFQEVKKQMFVKAREKNGNSPQTR